MAPEECGQPCGGGFGFCGGWALARANYSSERLLSTTGVRAQQPLRLFWTLLRQDQKQEYEAEETYGFDDSHGDDDEDQPLALAF